MKRTNYNLFEKEMCERGYVYALDRTAQLGFDAIEFIDLVPNNVQRMTGPDMARDMRAEMDKRGLTISCYSLLVDLAAENVDEQLEKVCTHIECAAILGTPFMHHTIVPWLSLPEGAPSYGEMFKRIIDNADKIARMCNERGIICLYEPQGMYFNGVDGLMPLLTEMKVRGRKVGICGDLGNSYFADTAPTEIFKSFKDDILHIHIKDYLYEKTGNGDYTSRGGASISVAEIGEGSTDFEKCLSFVKGYDGAISYEFVGDDGSIMRAHAFVDKLVRDIS